MIESLQILSQYKLNLLVETLKQQKVSIIEIKSSIINLMKIFVSFCQKLCITQILLDFSWDSFATIAVYIFFFFTSISLYPASSHSPTCLKDLIKKGKNHQDFAPDATWRLSGMTNISGGINLRIAATPHFVLFMTCSAMLQHLNVIDYALIAGIGDTPCNFVAS